MNNKIIDDILNEMERYQETTGNVPSAIIMNDKDAKRLFDSMRVRDVKVDYKSIKNITFRYTEYKNIRLYRTIDIDRGNFKII